MSFRKITRSIISFLVIGSFLTIPAGAVGTLPEKNSQQRHEVCASLSQACEEYYTGEYSYENLFSLSGASDDSTSSAAMQDNELFDALHKLMSETHTYYTTYSGIKQGSLAYFWASTDAVSDSESYVMFYSDVPSVQNNDLNREHIWPKSRASFGLTGGGADLHHLRPALDKVNSDKSDHLFAYIDGTYVDGYSDGSVDGKVMYHYDKQRDLFECKDDVKGDVARILLYVYCRWEQPNLYSDIADNELPPSDSDSTNNGKRVIESLDTLLTWCANDPVDSWEMERNDLTEQVQGNRNVFIDYPELAWQLFGEELPVGMSTPTHPGCDHEYAVNSRTEASCLTDGSFTMRCGKCGNEYTRRLACEGHSDSNGDEYCDKCGDALTLHAGMEKATYPNDGDHLVLFHPSTSRTLSKGDGENGRMSTTTVKPKNGFLNPTPDAEVFTVKLAKDDTFYLMSGGKYLSCSDDEYTLDFAVSPDNHCLWKLTPTGTAGRFFIDSAEAKSGDSVLRLQIYSGSMTVRAAGTTASFRFELYTTGEHLWDEGTIVREPSAFDKGQKIHSCLLCGETREEEFGELVRLLGDVDGDEEVTIIDATLIRRRLADIPCPVFIDEVSDTDRNGSLELPDATNIQLWLEDMPFSGNIGEPISG